MEEWTIPVLADSYKQLEKGRKVKEALIPDPSDPKKDFEKLEIGDIVNFVLVTEELEPVDGADKLSYQVSAKRHYEGTSASEALTYMFRIEGLENFFPKKQSLFGGEQAYRQVKENFENMAKHGVYAITFGENAQEVIAGNKIQWYPWPYPTF